MDNEKLLIHLDSQREKLKYIYQGAGYNKLISLKQELWQLGFNVELEQLTGILNKRYGIRCSTGSSVVFKMKPSEVKPMYHQAVRLKGTNY